MALDLVSSVPRVQAKANEVCYNAAIRACEKGGLREIAVSLLNSMPRIKLKTYKQVEQSRTKTEKQ